MKKKIGLSTKTINDQQVNIKYNQMKIETESTFHKDNFYNIFESFDAIHKI